MNRQLKQLIKDIAMFLLQGIVGATFFVFIVFMMLEWVSGCGETYVDSKGNTHVGECVITITSPTIRK